MPRQGQEYYDYERRIFWECLKMEIRYGVDVTSPDSGLASLELVTLSSVLLEWSDCSMPSCDGIDAEPARRHVARFDWCLSNLAIRASNAFYSKSQLEWSNIQPYHIPTYGQQSTWKNWKCWRRIWRNGVPFVNSANSGLRLSTLLQTI
jgi:hypothetical protein